MAVRIPIFEYHDLNEGSGGAGSFHSPYVLAREKFYAQMEWLYTNHYQAISLDDLFSGTPPEKAIILTFDDGHISNYEIALPILKRFNFQATFFLVSQFVGKKEYLSTTQVQEMQANGMRFGSHTMTHPYLLSLDRHDMLKEMSESKKQIRKVTKRPVKHFCIPYGFYNKELIQCARDAGYRSVVTERMGYYKTTQEAFKMLPRFTIKANSTLQDFVNIVLARKIKMLPTFLTEQLLEGAKKSLGFRNYMRLKSMLLKIDGIVKSQKSGTIA